MIRTLRFLARNRMLTPRYARLLYRYLWRRFLTPAGWRWETDGPVFFGKGLELQIAKRGTIRFGRFVWIGDRTKIRCHEGEVIVGQKSVLGQECTISAYRHVRIGEQCVIADRAMFIDFDHGVVEVERPIRLQGIYKRDVDVGSNVWVGYGACVLRGVRVGDNSVIGTNSVLTKDIPANAVVGGVPARLLRMRDAPSGLRWPDPVAPDPERREHPAARLNRAPASGAGAVANEPLVDRRGRAGDVGPVEAEDVIGALGDEAVAQLAIGEQALDHLAERLRVAGAEAKSRLAVGDDLAQAAGVGDDAGAARGHRLKRDEAERLVDRRHHADVGDRVQRVQHVVADPAEEGAVVIEAELGRLAAQLRLVRPRARDQKARPGDLVDDAGHRLERELEPFS